MGYRSNCVCLDNAPGFEDSYGAWEFKTFDVLLAACNLEFHHEHFGPLNVPVWISHVDGIVQLGLLLPRHGQGVIWTAPATDEQVNQLRDLVAEVWTGRIDGGFRRY